MKKKIAVVAGFSLAAVLGAAFGIWAVSVWIAQNTGGG